MRVTTAFDVAAAARGRRADLGLSQSEVSRRIGVSRKWLSDFETGKVAGDLSMVLRLLDVLGMVVDVAVPGHPASSGTAPPVDLDALLDRFTERSP